MDEISAFVDVSAAPIWANAGMGNVISSPEAQRAARVAAISGARALVSEIQFEALVRLCVASGTVPADAAQAMLSETAIRLSRYVCSFEPEWRPCRAEIAHNVRRLEKMAREIAP